MKLSSYISSMLLLFTATSSLAEGVDRRLTIRGSANEERTLAFEEQQGKLSKKSKKDDESKKSKKSKGDSEDDKDKSKEKLEKSGKKFKDKKSRSDKLTKKQKYPTDELASDWLA